MNNYKVFISLLTVVMALSFLSSTIAQQKGQRNTTVMSREASAQQQLRDHPALLGKRGTKSKTQVTKRLVARPISPVQEVPIFLDDILSG